MSTGASRFAPILCCVALIAALLVIVTRFATASPVDTNIQSVLPRSANAGALDAAISQTSEALASRVTFLIDAPDAETAIAAATDLEQRLVATGLYESGLEEATETARWIHANRDELLCVSPDAFDAEAAQRTRRNALAQIYSVTGVVNGDLLASDPFLRTPELASCLSPAQPQTGAPTQRLVTGRLTASAYQLDTQTRVAEIYDDFLGDWTGRNVTAARTGTVFFAAAAADQARADVTRIGLIGAIGVIALFSFVFLRLRAALIALAVVAFGLTVGIGAALLIFPAVNVLVFVFAAMLVGIASDYAIHALATGPATNWAEANERRRQLMRPTTISLVTTVLGFGCLGLFGIPLLQQVAVMAGAGLFAAWAFVLYVVVPFDKAPAKPARQLAQWTRLADQRKRLTIPRIALLVIALAALAASLFGASKLAFNDDVRTFQTRPADLIADESRISENGVQAGSAAFLYTEAGAPDAARSAETEALALLPQDASLLALSRFDPSTEARADARVALDETLYQPLYAAHASQLGLDAGTHPAPTDPAVERPAWFAALEGERAGRFFLAAPIASGDLAPGARIGSSIVVDPVDTYTNAFAAYRGYAVLALMAAIIGGAVVILLVYRRARALVIVACPAAALVFAILAPAALGVPINFFTIAAGLVLLGVGLDYAAFEWEAGEKGERWTSLAVTMDAVTTFLSMGLLALSATIPVQSFGTTIAIGVAAALALSGLARLAGRRTPA